MSSILAIILRISASTPSSSSSSSIRGLNGIGIGIGIGAVKSRPATSMSRTVTCFSTLRVHARTMKQAKYRKINGSLFKANPISIPTIPASARVLVERPTLRTALFSSLKVRGSDCDFQMDEENWREHPDLTETLMVPTIIVPSEHLHSMISSGKGLLTPILLTLENVHPRIKSVQNLDKIGIVGGEYESDEIRFKKAILLDPDSVGTATNGEIDSDVSEQIEGKSESESKAIDLLSKSFPLLQQQLIESLASKSAIPGPMVPISLDYKQQTLQSILAKLLPEEAMPPPTGFEQIGHVVHLNLKEHHNSFKKLIGSVILDRLPQIETVVNKVGEVSGPYRTYNMEVLAGKESTMVRLNEDGVSLEFDLRKVYWCTRLSGERSRLLNEFKEGDVVADAFCGAGAFVVQAAIKKGCRVYANDLNPEAVKYCRENAKNNLKRYKRIVEGTDGALIEVKEKPIVKVTCGDAFDFIQNLGELYALPHHVVMNFPLDSPSFLAALRWWPTDGAKKIVPAIHLYTFARGDDVPSENEDNDDAPLRDAAEVAVDVVADALLPDGGAIEASKNRRSLLNEMGCDVTTKEVRDVAPGKVVIYVSFKVTETLLRVMQGDFVDF